MNPQRGHLSAEMAQAFLDGRASAEEARQVEELVARCGESRALLDEWRAVYARLGHLEPFEAPEGFASNVMERYQREVAEAAVAFDANGYLTTEALLEYLDGEATPERAAAVRQHLAASTRCAEQEAQWTSLFASLETVGHHAPSEEFADRVMEAAGVLEPEPGFARVLGVRVRAIDPNAGWLKKAVINLRDRDRRSMAILAGLGTAPAVVMATLAWVVLTHPLVTTSGLVRYAFLKGGQMLDGIVAAVMGGSSESGLLALLSSAVDLVAGAPGAAALGAAALLLLSSVSTWVLYKHLGPNRESMDSAPAGRGLVRANG